MHINDDMTINSIESVFITNYFNVNLKSSITLTIYVNNTLYLASKRIYYFNSNSYNYITIISKSNTLFQNDEWSHKMLGELQTVDVSNLLYLIRYYF